MCWSKVRAGGASAGRTSSLWADGDPEPRPAAPPRRARLAAARERRRGRPPSPPEGAGSGRAHRPGIRVRGLQRSRPRGHPEDRRQRQLRAAAPRRDERGRRRDHEQRQQGRQQEDEVRTQTTREASPTARERRLSHHEAVRPARPTRDRHVRRPPRGARIGQDPVGPSQRGGPEAHGQDREKGRDPEGQPAPSARLAGGGGEGKHHQEVAPEGDVPDGIRNSRRQSEERARAGDHELFVPSAYTAT
jgi:hypothetical protein